MIIVEKLSSNAFKVTTDEAENIITFLQHKNAYYIKDLNSTFTQVTEDTYKTTVELFNSLTYTSSSSEIKRNYDSFKAYFDTLESLSIHDSNNLIDKYNEI